MTWFDNLLNHFALYPAHLFVLLFVMALSKSTVLISSVLPPASVMLLAGITVSQGSMHPALTWLAVVMGATAGSVLNYHIGQLMGHTRMVTRFTSKHAISSCGSSISCKRTGSSCFLRRASWRCCVTSSRWRPGCSG